MFIHLGSHRDRDGYLWGTLIRIPHHRDPWATLTLTISWIAAVDLKHNQPNHTIPAVLARVTDFIHTLVGFDLSQDGPWDFTEKPLPKCSECMDYDIYIHLQRQKIWGFIWVSKNHFRGLIEKESCKSSKSKQIWDRGKSSKSKSRGKITCAKTLSLGTCPVTLVHISIVEVKTGSLHKNQIDCQPGFQACRKLSKAEGEMVWNSECLVTDTAFFVSREIIFRFSATVDLTVGVCQPSIKHPPFVASISVDQQLKHW